MLPPTPNRPSKGETAYQMLWDCRFCGTTKLLGVDHRHCPNCGAKQEPSARYFPSEADKKLVSDPNYKYVGADKICPFCGEANSAAANFCRQCGGDLSGAQEAERRETIVKGSAEDTGQGRDLVKERFQADLKMGAMPQKSTARAPIGLFVGIAVLAVIAIVAFIFLSRSTYGASLTVNNLTWERTIAVERFTLVPGSAWQNEVPFGAQQLSCSPQSRTYTRSEQYECGVERVDRGDGSFIERPRFCTRQVSESRIENRCSYVLPTWVSDGNRQASGGPNNPLRWPNFTPSANQREAGRSETLNVIFNGNGPKAGQQFTYRAANENEWRSYEIGQEYTVEFNRLEQVQWRTLKRAEAR